jgi:hypothetical protein
VSTIVPQVDPVAAEAFVESGSVDLIAVLSAVRTVPVREFITHIQSVAVIALVVPDSRCFASVLSAVRTVAAEIVTEIQAVAVVAFVYPYHFITSFS